jgi:Rps23 Pro-64 3,4-dihydroxylase Tpa1-like proline 4-hydroxylase
MEIKNFVSIFDNVLKLETLSNLLRFANKVNFNETQIIGSQGAETNFNIRRTYTHVLSNLSNNLSDVHWANLIYNTISIKLNEYKKINNIIDFGWESITNIEILKYNPTGFYTWHTDHHASVPRTMSCIYLLNNDYKGGNLCFRNPDGSGEWEVEVKPNRMIIWPSSFLYPHTVKSVTEGTRYSVVAWAL